MNLKNNVFICLSIIMIGSVNGSINNTNQVDNDHRIRNFAFSGPFISDINMDSLKPNNLTSTFRYFYLFHKVITKSSFYCSYYSLLDKMWPMNN